MSFKSNKTTNYVRHSGDGVDLSFEWEKSEPVAMLIGVRTDTADICIRLPFSEWVQILEAVALRDVDAGWARRPTSSAASTD